MKILPLLAKLIIASGLTVFLFGCETLPPVEEPPPPPPPSPSPPSSRASSIDVANTSQYTTVVERIFAEGLDFYDKGEYESAIKKFQSPRLVNASWPELRIRTLKYLAFSYCLTNELNACQQAFYDAMQLNPQFKLLPSEEGHPIWGPIYQKARLGPPENTNRFPHSRTTAKKRSKAREQARKADAQPPIQKD